MSSFPEQPLSFGAALTRAHRPERIPVPRRFRRTAEALHSCVGAVDELRVEPRLASGPKQRRSRPRSDRGCRVGGGRGGGGELSVCGVTLRDSRR